MPLEKYREIYISHPLRLARSPTRPRNDPAMRGGISNAMRLGYGERMDQSKERERIAQEKGQQDLVHQERQLRKVLTEQFRLSQQTFKMERAMAQNFSEKSKLFNIQ